LLTLLDGIETQPFSQSWQSVKQNHQLSWWFSCSCAPTRGGCVVCFGNCLFASAAIAHDYSNHKLFVRFVNYLFLLVPTARP
jgi:hypothetical protein